MTPEEYQREALRTEYTPDFVRLEGRSAEHNMMIARLIHAQLGLTSEAGEIADALKKHIIYGAELDKLNVFEELGDGTWYTALGLAAVRRGFEDALTANIAKLRSRFPHRFTAEAALNRDLDAERKALEGESKGIDKPATNDDDFTIELMRLVDTWRAGDSIRAELKAGVEDALNKELARHGVAARTAPTVDAEDRRRMREAINADVKDDSVRIMLHRAINALGNRGVAPNG